MACVSAVGVAASLSAPRPSFPLSTTTTTTTSSSSSSCSSSRFQAPSLACSLLPPRPATCTRHVAGSGRRRAQRSACTTAAAKSTFKSVVVEPDYRIPLVLLGSAALFVALDQKLVAAPVGLLGVLLMVQTTRVRFLFDTDSLEVVIGEEKKSSGENTFVGGANRWRYDTFVNWEFWWPDFPVLVYFKETQTKPEGQIHFFPIIANGKQLYEIMKERCGPSMNSTPK